MAFAKRVHHWAVIQTSQMPHAVSQKPHGVFGRVLPVQQAFPLQRVQRKQQSAGNARPARKRQYIGRPRAAKMHGIGLCRGRIVQQVQLYIFRSLRLLRGGRHCQHGLQGRAHLPPVQGRQSAS